MFVLYQTHLFRKNLNIYIRNGRLWYAGYKNLVIVRLGSTCLLFEYQYISRYLRGTVIENAVRNIPRIFLFEETAIQKIVQGYVYNILNLFNCRIPMIN